MSNKMSDLEKARAFINSKAADFAKDENKNGIPDIMENPEKLELKDPRTGQPLNPKAQEVVRKIISHVSKHANPKDLQKIQEARAKWQAHSASKSPVDHSASSEKVKRVFFIIAIGVAIAVIIYFIQQ
jgi:hypothetical protein